MANFMANFYTQHIFPSLVEWTMAGEPFRTYRRQLLTEATGEVLEIGFGTGLNLPHYGDRPRSLTLVDPNQGMQALAQARIAAAPFPVKVYQMGGEALPLEDASVDCVVSTWTLCSIAAVDQAMGEIHRVLRSGGRFLFLEHGLSDRPDVQRWQHRLTPIQRVIADGCHLDRNMGSLVERWFDRVEVDRFEAENLPAIVGTLYRGIATKA